MKENCYSGGFGANAGPCYTDADGLETVEAWECVPGCPVAELDRQGGPQKSGGTPRSRKAAKTLHAYGDFNGEENPNGIGRSEGNVSRFFYCAKASRSDRGDGNTHPTVKSTKLMQWLVKLVCPPGGTVLDPFMGSGSTGKACVETGRNFIGIEREAAYFAIAQKRIAEAEAKTATLFSQPKETA